MSYKEYYVTLLPGSRPNGAKQFSSAKEEQHYQTTLNGFRPLKGFKELGKLGAFRAELTEEQVERFNKNPLVSRVEEAIPRSRDQVLTQSGVGWALASMADRVVDEKFTYLRSGKGVNIYIVDCGVNCELDEFEGRASEIYSNMLATDPITCMHGTAVACCAAGKTYGTAKKANILSVRSEAPDCLIYSTDGLDAVLAHHQVGELAVCNMSFGAASEITLETDAVNALLAEGVICIASAGNETVDTPHFPSDNCISVGSYEEDNSVSPFSNYGINVHFFAPGGWVDTLDHLGNYVSENGTSLSSPYVAGIAATLIQDGIACQTQAEILSLITRYCAVAGVTHAYDGNTNNLAVRSQIPMVWEGVVGAGNLDYDEVLPKLDFRKTYLLEFFIVQDDGSEVFVADSNYLLTRYADGAIVLSNGGAFSKEVASTVTAIKISPGEQPSALASYTSSYSSGGASASEQIVYTEIAPDDLISLSISLNPSGGTAYFSTKIDDAYAIKDYITLQGLSCLIAKIKPMLGPGKEYSVECRVMSIFSQEYISISKPYLGSAQFHSVTELISEAAASAGIAISVNAADIKVQDFIQGGKFVDVLTTLASMLHCTLIQQNGSWYVSKEKDAIGDFTISADKVISYSRARLGDVSDTVLSLINELLAAEAEAEALRKAIEDLEDDLEDAQETVEDEDALEEETSLVATTQHMGNINIKFGQVNNTQWQAIESSYEIISSHWEYWTPDADSNVNPSEPAKDYYCVQEVLDENGDYADEMRGLTDLNMCKIKVEIQEPSNFGGIYYARGRSVNFFGSFSTVLWFSIPYVEENILDEITNTYETHHYFEFTPWPPNIIDFTTPRDDKRLYFLDLEIRYRASRASAWGFAGTLVFDYWPIKANGVYIGRVNVDGDFYSASGEQITTIDDLADLPGGVALVPESKACVLDNNGALCAVTAGTYFNGITGVFAGQFNTTTHDILSNTTLHGALLGWVSGDIPISLAWPGLGSTDELATAVPIYFTDDMPGSHGIDFSTYDPDNPELWDPTVDPAATLQDDTIAEIQLAIDERTNELATVLVNIAYLRDEITSYGAASLLSLINTAVLANNALVEEQERQDDLGITNLQLLGTKQDELGAAMSSIYSALSSLNLEAIEVNCSFIYDNVLPLPQNLLTIQGIETSEDDLIITSVDLQLKSSTVSVVATRRIA